MTDIPPDRRGIGRATIDIDAYLDTREGRQKVRLIDLSQTGAHLVLSQPEAVREGVLKWLDFDTFGIAIWSEGEELGLQFDRPLSPRIVDETHRRAPSVVAELAQSWVSGGISDD